MQDNVSLTALRLGSSVIVGTGEAAPKPEEMVGNDEVLTRLKTAGFDIGDKTGESTEKLVGIATRWWTPVDRDSFDLALEAARNAVEDAQAHDRDFDLSRIRVVHSGGSTPDMIHPAIACRLQFALGVPVGEVESRDIMLACTSAIDGLALADSRLRQLALEEAQDGLPPKPLYALVAVGETIGSQANPPVNLDYTLWGCAGGAILLKYDPQGDPAVGIQGTRTVSDGEHSIFTESIGVGHRRDYWDKAPFATMGVHGKDLHRYAIREVSRQLKKFMARQGLQNLDERAAFLPHNSNLSMQLSIGKELGFLPERVFTRIKDRGNTSSASIPITLDYYRRKGCFESGDRLLIAAFGGGMSMCFVDYVCP